jgi:signal transduction histidine kinase
MKLQTKITLLTTTILVSVVFFTLLPVRGTIMNTLRKELEKKGISVAGNLSDRIVNNIILKDYFQTAKALNEVLKKEKDIEYIFVTNEDADLFADTFKNGAPPGILGWNPLGKASQHIQLLDTEKGYIRDVGVRVIDGTKSELHLGLREDMLHDTRIQMRYLTIPIIVVVVLLGIAASFVMSRFITNPLNKFVEFTKVLGKGEYGSRVDVRYGDEIGYLARNFNTLSMQLKTAREKMEEAYTYTHLLEAEKLSSIGQISAGLAHELKNPLTSLKMLFQAFKEQPDMTREDAEVISSEIEKMDRVLSNFMGFVKQKGFRLSETNLNELIERVLSLATYDIENANIVVRKDMIGTLPPVEADRGLLEQVFLNLVINAVHAMPGGGEIRISGKSDDSFVEVMVWDKGSGIPSDIREKIFNPFFTTKEGGTGLGLAIAYNIVKSHGGKLFFNSDEGRGTVFTVRLPIEAEHG